MQAARWLGASSSSGSSSSQGAASTAFLAVLLTRGLLQLAAAMEAAGPQLLFRCFAACEDAKYRLGWALQGKQLAIMFYTASVRCIEPGVAQQHTMEGEWHIWQLYLLRALRCLLAALRLYGVMPKATTATAAATAAAPDAPTAPSFAVGHPSNASPSSSSSSSSSNQQTKWGHLLQLPLINPTWAAAAAAFNTKWNSYDWGQLQEQLFSVDASEAETAQQLYQDVLQLCRALVAAAPITVVCNNPSCTTLAGVSEAAASCKACGRCGCRYCSVACQRADWRRHKQACQCMAAAGMTCG
uniref:phytol kinase n=1 Tax=Tetradesmus obliquus TaxID=3088 RepID=A0A383VY06_TETOB